MIIPRARDWISLFQFFQTINRRNLSERKVISFDKGVTSAAAGRFNLAAGLELVIQTKAIQRFVITEEAPTRAFSWLKADPISR